MEHITDKDYQSYPHRAIAFGLALREVAERATGHVSASIIRWTDGEIRASVALDPDDFSALALSLNAEVENIPLGLKFMEQQFKRDGITYKTTLPATYQLVSVGQ